MSDGGAQHIVFGPFFDSSGTILPNIKVYHYNAGTTNDADMWSDEDKATTVAQPFVGDTNGIARLFGDNIYKIVIRDENDNLLYTWDDVQISRDVEGVVKNGTSYPSVVPNNTWQLAVKIDGGGNFVELGLNDGASFIPLVNAAGDIYFRLGESGAAALNKNWEIIPVSEQLRLRLANDDFTSFTNILTVDRTGMTADLLNIVTTALQLNGVAVLGSIDEDDMVSDSASLVPTQQSTKAYIDAHGVIQRVTSTNAAYTSDATIIPYDDSIPQSGEGFEVVTVAITPTNVNSILRIEANVPFSLGAPGVGIIALFQDAAANALAANSLYIDLAAGGGNGPLLLKHEMAAGTTSSTTFKIRIGPSAGTIYINGTNVARRFGGVLKAILTITELKP